MGIARGDAESRERLEARWREGRDPNALLYLAFDAERRGATDEAESLAKATLLLPQVEAELLARVGWLFLRGGRPQRALDLLVAAGVEDRAHGRLDEVRGEAHRRLGHPEAARRFMARAFEAEPSGRWQARRLFYAHLSAGAFRAALRTLSRHFRALSPHV